MKLQKYNVRLCPSCLMDDKIINSKISSPDPSDFLPFNANKETWAGLFYKKTKSFFSSKSFPIKYNKKISFNFNFNIIFHKF